MDVLVIDIGGSHVKMRLSRTPDVRRFASGSKLAPTALIAEVQSATRDWRYDVISVGFPGLISNGTPGAEPGHLGDGWIGFDFTRAFGKPVRLVNDAVMQALGAYDGGRMLFLGLGTGLGSALVTEHVVVPLELGNLPFRNGRTMGDCLGRRGLEENGLQRWMNDVRDATTVLRSACAADYVVLGGGNAERVEPLPEHTRRGGNEDAFTGGFRLWDEVVEPHDREPRQVWRVVR
jgi:polyphosphate glucokinase